MVLTFKYKNKSTTFSTITSAKYYHKFLGNCFFSICYNLNLKCISKNIISITIVLYKGIVGIIHVKTKILFSFSSPLMILSNYLYHNNAFGLKEIILYLYKQK